MAACGARSGLDVPVVDVAASRDGGVNANDATVPPDVVSPPPGLDCAEAGITYIFAIGFTPEGQSILYSFYPSTSEFTQVGALACPDDSLAFSMAVDHKGTAYVLYASGRLYKVSTRTGECEATPFQSGQQGFVPTFGMGFVAGGFDGGGGETLYVAGDPLSGDAGVPSPLGKIDVTTFQLTNLGLIGDAPGGLVVNKPELTGTGGGRLYGFFAPDDTNPPSFIVGIDPVTRAVVSTVDLPGVVEGGGWAFGFWGGDFYTFTAPNAEFGDPTSVVTRYRPSDGSIAQVATAPEGVEIVGAGVSTCAPQ